VRVLFVEMAACLTPLVLVSVRYGAGRQVKDVRQDAEALCVKKGGGFIIAAPRSADAFNQLFGDPAPGSVKTLTICYKYGVNGVKHTLAVEEDAVQTAINILSFSMTLSLSRSLSLSLLCRT
jgi:hypothetical protein